MNQTVLNIMLTFFPGIIVTSILQFFNPRNKKYSNIEFILYSFVYGIIIIIISDNFLLNTNIDFTLSTLPSKKILSTWLLISFIIGIVISGIRNCGILHYIAYKLHISYEHGYENSLDFIYKSSFKKAKELRSSYVNVKLLDGSATYYGTLVSQEIHSTHTEIVLKNVRVFFNNNPLDKRYTQDGIYLQLIPGTFFMEFVFVESKKIFPYMKFFLIYIFVMIIHFII